MSLVKAGSVVSAIPSISRPSVIQGLLTIGRTTTAGHRKRDEWGYIGQYETRTVFGYPCVEYSGNQIKECAWREGFGEDYYQRKVKKVKASGGWSRMDYLITFE